MEDQAAITPGPSPVQRYQISNIRKGVIFGVLCLLILTQNLYFSLPLPFLTHEIIKARKQKSIIGGILTGIFPLMGAVTSLVAGLVASKTTAKKMIFWTGVAYFLSSAIFLVPMSNNLLFDATVFIARVTQGAVLGLAEPVVVAVMGALFPNSLGMVTALYELAFSASLSLGPLMGGFLYDAGGFSLPFIVTGSLQLFVSIMAILIIPKREVYSTSDEEVDEKSQHQSSGIIKSVRLPIFLLGILLTSTISADETFVGNFLAIYLKQRYHKEVNVTGTVLMVTGIFYSLATMLFGYLTDRGLSRTLSVTVGLLVLIIGSFLIDPSTILTAWPKYIYPGIMFGLLEVGSAMAQVSILPLLVFHDREFDIERSTEAMTGVYNAGFFLGAFFGPLLGSALLGSLSFSATFTIFSGLMLLIFVVVGVAHLKMGNLLSIKGKIPETEKLLS